MSDDKKTAENQFRANILALVSHELNTPLSGIINSLSVLESHFPKNDEFVAMLKRNAERLDKAVKNMMELSYADAGSLRVRLTEINLENIILLQLEKLKPFLDKSSFTPVILIEKDVPTICADARRLAQVVNTLITNAVKFSDTKAKEISDSKRKVNISMSLQEVSKIPQAERLDDLQKKTAMYLIVEIFSSLPPVDVDGVNPQEIFKPFGSNANVNVREREGLGLELPLAKEILLAHKGALWVDIKNKANKPWSFKFALPVLSREDELEEVISNRLRNNIGLHTKVSILLIRANEALASKQSGQELRAIEKKIRELLFRSSDAVFSLDESAELIVVMDDCDEIGAERVAQRLIKDVKSKLKKIDFQWSVATGPQQGVGASELIEFARKNWR